MRAPVVSAASATMVPDSDGAVTGWGVGVANDTTCVGGTLCDTVDEGVSDKTSDYIRATATTSGESVTLGLSDASNVGSATQLSLRVYAQANTVGRSVVDTLSVNLLVNGTPQTAGTCTPGNASWVACTVNFPGTWNQTAVNSMQVQIVRSVLGSGGNAASQADDTWIANVYGNLTYTPSISTEIDQSAYRWFENADATGARSFISAYGNSSSQIGNYSIAQLNDGGYAVVGNNGTTKALISHYDADGGVRSSRILGALTDSLALSVAKTSDGGFVATGYLQAAGGGLNQVMLVKYDALGTLEWLKTWTEASHSVGNSVVQTADGGYAVTGSINDRALAFLAKYDASGNLIWNKTWGAGTGQSDGNSVVQTSDGGYVMAGMTNSFGAGSTDAFLAKYDASGNLIWNKTWGGTGSESGNSVVLASSGNLVIVGTTSGFGAGSNDAFIAKYDASGNLIWNKTWGGTGAEKSNSVAKTSDDGYVLAGLTTSFGAGSTDAFIAKYDTNGNLIWSKTWGGTGTDEAGSVIQTSDGGLAVAGLTGNFGAGSNDMVILRYNAQYEVTNCQPTQCRAHSASTTSPSAVTLSPSVTPQSSTLVTAATTAGTTLGWTRTEIAALTPSEIATGSALASQNTATAISGGNIARLRLNLHVSQLAANAGSAQLKLQFAPKASAATCSVVANGTYGDVTNSSNGIRWADNANASNGLNATTGVSDPTHGNDTTVAQTYHEAGTTTFSNKNAINIGQDGMWDFALTTSTPAVNGSYCLRVINSDGTPLNTYSQYPEISVGDSMPSLGFVNSSGTPISSPSFALADKNFLSSCQTSTATLGSSSGNKLRISQAGSSTNWNIAISATGGATATWSSSGNYFDFNDSAGSPAGCANGSDGDMYAGQLTLDKSTSSLSPQSGCSNNGLSLDSNSTAFDGAVESISLLSGSTSAQSNCYWDLYGTTFSQKIPANQPAGNYSLDLMITITAS